MTVWLVDEEWVFRFPRRQTVIPGLLNEISHLPNLASLLPLPIPVPTYLGEPSAEYGWPFYGAPFLPGRELAEAGLDDGARIALARPLGEFLRTLHGTRLDADLPLDPFRRADMTLRVPKTRERLAELKHLGLWHAAAGSPRGDRRRRRPRPAGALGPGSRRPPSPASARRRRRRVRRPSSIGSISATTIPASTSSSTGASCRRKAASSFARPTGRSRMTSSSAPASSPSSSAARWPSTGITRGCRPETRGAPRARPHNPQELARVHQPATLQDGGSACAAGRVA